MISSLADVAKSFVSHLVKDFGFEGGRLKRFERRRVCMERRIKMIEFLNFLPLGFMNLHLGLSSTKFTLAFISDLVLEFCLC